jgi:hypothetical protein
MSISFHPDETLYEAIEFHRRHTSKECSLKVILDQIVMLLVF